MLAVLLVLGLPLAGVADGPVCDAPAQLQRAANQRHGHALIDAELNNATLLLCLMKAVRGGQDNAPVRGWLDQAFMQLGNLLLDTDRPVEAARIARAWWTLATEGERPLADRQRAELHIAELLEAGGYRDEADAHYRSVVAAYGDPSPRADLWKIARDRVLEKPNPDRAGVCGRVALADGGNGPVLARLWHRGGRRLAWAGEDGGYCLYPLPQTEADVAYLILSAPGHLPHVTRLTLSPGVSNQLPGVTLTALERPELGMVAGFVYGQDRVGEADEPEVSLAGKTLGYQGDEGLFEGVTDANGVALVAVPAGEYRIVGGQTSVVVRASHTVLGPHPQSMFNASASADVASDRAELGLSP